LLVECNDLISGAGLQQQWTVIGQRENLKPVGWLRNSTEARSKTLEARLTPWKLEFG
jgi:hypothetical protein